MSEYSNELELDTEGEVIFVKKTLKNTPVDGTTKNASDLVKFGDVDMFKLLCKAHSENEGWMKCTKAMEVKGAGCLVQVTTQQRNFDGSYVVAEALQFVPDVKITTDKNDGRKLVHKSIKT